MLNGLGSYLRSDGAVKSALYILKGDDLGMQLYKEKVKEH